MLRLTLLGHNIKYSLSPKIHGMISARLGISADYTLSDIAPQALPSMMQRIKAGYDGCNITKPYKTVLDAYIDNYDESALNAQAVNTLINNSGSLTAANTDVDGIRFAITALVSKHGISKKSGNVLILGGGGAARACVAALKNDCTLYVCNRTFEKAAEIVRNFLLPESRALKIEHLPDINFDGVINCTVLGLNNELCLPAMFNLNSVLWAYDTIYNPAVTPFSALCRSKGIHFSNGLNMLVSQAVYSWEYWLKQKIDNKHELIEDIITQL